MVVDGVWWRFCLVRKDGGTAAVSRRWNGGGREMGRWWCKGVTIGGQKTWWCAMILIHMMLLLGFWGQDCWLQDQELDMGLKLPFL